MAIPCKNFSISLINLLTTATITHRIRWIRIPDYLFYNGRNKALINFVDMFSEVDTPTSVDDVPKADLMKSYYCEFDSAAFCLMYCSQVLQANQPPTEFYNLLIQQTPFDNFGYYSTPDEQYQVPLNELAKLAEMQVSQAYTDRTPLFHVLDKLSKAVQSFDPSREEKLTPRPPSPPHKHCCVIDANGYYVNFVLVLLEDSNGNKGEFVQYYTLKEGEQLIDANPPHGIVKPLWTGSGWKETATEEEIEHYYKAHRQ